jgi:antitoxin VapB
MDENMALSIRNPRAEKLARKLSAMSGENITEVIINALENQLVKTRGKKTHTGTVKDIMKISDRCSSLPDLDKRSPDEILGYNETGVNE